MAKERDECGGLGREGVVPKKGDALKFVDPNVAPASVGGRRRMSNLTVFAFPVSLKRPNPDFMTPPLLCGQIRALALHATQITLPASWEQIAQRFNALRISINNQPPFEVPFGVNEGTDRDGTVLKLRFAVRAALQGVAERINALERRHETGTAEPWPYRIAFGLTKTDNSDRTAEFGGGAGEKADSGVNRGA